MQTKRPYRVWWEKITRRGSDTVVAGSGEMTRHAYSGMQAALLAARVLQSRFGKDIFIHSLDAEVIGSSTAPAVHSDPASASLAPASRPNVLQGNLFPRAPSGK